MNIVAIRGQHVQPCEQCGEQVRWRLLYETPHLSEDEDFRSSSPELTTE